MQRNLMLLAAAAIGLTASVASAADLPRKAPSYAPPAPPPFSWTGLYIGINGGAGWGTVESTIDNISIGPPVGVNLAGLNVPLASHGVNGWLFGGQIGYNWQVQPWLVLGLEGDGAWSNLEGNAPCVIAINCHAKVKSMFDITGRVGYAVDRALVYVKGGVAWADTDYSATLFNVGAIPGIGGGLGGLSGLSTSASETRIGGLFGVGVEYAFLPNWSAKIEYNYMDFGHNNNVNFAFNVPVGGGSTPVAVSTTVRETINVIKFGVNYRFDWGRY